MSDLVSPDAIEEIVGAKRLSSVHLGRAVSAEQKVYVLHSQRCRDSGADLRACDFSLALDRGIEPSSWAGMEDVPVALGIWHRRLVPIRRLS